MTRALRFHAVSRCGPPAQRPPLGAPPSGALFGSRQVRPDPSDATGLSKICARECRGDVRYPGREKAGMRTRNYPDIGKISGTRKGLPTYLGTTRGELLDSVRVSNTLYREFYFPR